MKVDLTLSPKKPKFSSRDEQFSPAPWLLHLGLDENDRQLLLNSSAWLNDKVINASQHVLKQDHPHISRLQNTLLGQTLSFSVEPTRLSKCYTVAVTTGYVSQPLVAVKRGDCSR